MSNPQSLPTRSQLDGAMEFFASFAGSAYVEGGMVEVEDPANPLATVTLSERAIQTYIESWMRANWSHIVDYMVDSDCALEDSTIEDKPCPRTEAHGQHYWDESLFGGRVDATPENPIPEFHCEGHGA